MNVQRRSFLRVIGAAAATVALPLTAFSGSTPITVAVATAPIVGNKTIPEFWAAESLRILQDNMLVSQLVHRDFGEKHLTMVDSVVHF